ncbi:hypothetical protein FXO37_14649 [Capsicum annuum]|nr:hypothetical protein FXO37_14649 [Capsicum annuum]
MPPSSTTTVKLFFPSSRFSVAAQHPCSRHSHQRQPSPPADSTTSVGSLSHLSDFVKNVKSHFRTKVVVRDDCISLKGEGAPNVVGLFKGKTDSIFPMNRYDCDLPDLLMVLL